MFSFGKKNKVEESVVKKEDKLAVEEKLSEYEGKAFNEMKVPVLDLKGHTFSLNENMQLTYNSKKIEEVEERKHLQVYPGKVSDMPIQNRGIFVMNRLKGEFITPDKEAFDIFIRDLNFYIDAYKRDVLKAVER